MNIKNKISKKAFELSLKREEKLKNKYLEIHKKNNSIKMNAVKNTVLSGVTSAKNKISEKVTSVKKK